MAVENGDIGMLKSLGIKVRITHKSQPHISEILLADFFWIQLVIKRMYTLVRHFAKKQCPDPHLNDPDINDPDINDPYCI